MRKLFNLESKSRLDKNAGPVLYTSEDDSGTAPDDLFECEREREKSFKTSSYMTRDFAATGFYYYPRDSCDCTDTVDDRVRCFCCGIELIRWKDGNDPLVEHEKWSPSCVFIKDIENRCRYIFVTNRSFFYNVDGVFRPDRNI